MNPQGRKMVPPPVLPFGMPVNGFHPQVGALPNPVVPIMLPPFPSSSRRRMDGSSGLSSMSSSSSSSYSTSSSSSQRQAGQVSLSGLIDARTSTLVSRLREDVRNEERHHRRMVKKRRRTGHGSDSASSSSYSASSLSESDASSRSGAASRSVSSLDASSASSRRKRQRTSSCYKQIPRGGSSLGSGGKMKTFDVAGAPSAFASFSSKADNILPPKSFPAPKTVEPCYDSASPLSSSGSDTDQASSKGCSLGDGGDAHADGGAFSDLYSEVFLESERPQLIATLGGRIVAWNDEFLSSTGLLVSQLRGCVTVHNLVEPAVQSRLNDLFELALREGGNERGGACVGADPAHPPLMVIAPSADGRRGRLTGRRELRQVPAPIPGGVGAADGMSGAAAALPATPDDGSSRRLPGGDGLGVPGSDVAAVTGSGVGAKESAATVEKASSDGSGSSEEEDEDVETHLSITLPCRRFRVSTEQFCITIILMNDIDPSRRCFYCILTPPPTPPPTIAFPAPLVPPPTTQGNGNYKSIGNGWYSAVHTSLPTGDGALPVPNVSEMPLQTPFSPKSPALGKIRHIGQKELASLL